ncbi:unnamed protein product [Didymodactylos carnosus]|uniref:Uncharacterized protein n=2 Tax=Didymodactylos carnosus TaxID=1234261 RepID=A0A814B668_9BILA|nr:unnamed protein product [Didymodactylos carnosus]CAF3703733.1 unnamed protein product [Didymodactylos carnosus]
MEQLLNEIFLDYIVMYLKGYDIVYSCSNVNARFDELIYSYTCHLNITIPYDLDQLYRTILPRICKHIRSFKLDDKEHRLITKEMHRFTFLQSLTTMNIMDSKIYPVSSIQHLSNLKTAFACTIHNTDCAKIVSQDICKYIIQVERRIGKLSIKNLTFTLYKNCMGLCTNLKKLTVRVRRVCDMLTLVQYVPLIEYLDAKLVVRFFTELAETHNISTCIQLSQNQRS